MQKLLHFKSYSNDNFYMLTSDESLMGKFSISAERFCEKYIPSEYEGWKGKKFKYSKFDKYDVDENGIVRIPLNFGEVDVIDTKGMKEDEAVFSDCIKYLNE